MSLLAYALKTAQAFDRAKANYALVGGLACILFGVRRMTEDADFIVDVDSLELAKVIFQELKKEGFDISFKEVSTSYKERSYFTILVEQYRVDIKLASSKLDFETLNRAVEVV